MYMILVHPSKVVTWKIVKNAYARLSKLVIPQFKFCILVSLYKSDTFMFPYLSNWLIRDPQKVPPGQDLSPQVLTSFGSAIQSPPTGVGVILHL